MGKKRLRKWGLGIVALLVAILVGCQAVGGFNFDDVILNQLEVDAQEQAGSFTMEVDWNEEALAAEADAESAALLAWLNKFTVTIGHAKSSADGKSVMEGSVRLGDKPAIPFTLHTDAKTLRLDVAGIKAPLILDLAGEETMGLGMAMGPEIDPNTLKEPMRKLVRTVGSYFIHHLPNPPKFEIGLATTSINGVGQAFTKVHAELDGAQLGDLVLAYVDALIKDKEGFAKMLTGVLQWTKELPPELTEGGMLPLGDMGTGGDEAEAAQAATDALFPMLEELQAELIGASKEDEWKEIFDAGLSLKTDLYIDEKLHVRKSDTEIAIAPALFQQPDSPVRSVKLRMASETWNVNGDVQVADVQTPPGAYDAARLGDLQPVQVLQMLDPDSALYGLLKNDLKIDDASFTLDNGWDEQIIADDRAGGEDVPYVQLRSVLDGLGDRASFEPTTGEVRFTDKGTWQEIVLHVDSVEALANAQKMKLSHPVRLIDNSTYVAADDLFRLLHADYRLTTDEYGEPSIAVTRDL